MKKGTKTYKAWYDMWRRCTVPWDASYPRYGAQGISVSPTWKIYEQFLTDMGECPEGLTLDRINNNLGYSPENCRWTSYAIQNKNRKLPLGITNLRGITSFILSGKLVFGAYTDRPFRKNLYRGVSFFEAVCCRKSWENLHV